MHVLGVLVHMGPLGFMRHCSLAVRETKIPNHIYIATVSLFFSSEHCISGSLHTYLVKQEHLKPKKSSVIFNDLHSVLLSGSQHFKETSLLTCQLSL